MERVRSCALRLHTGSAVPTGKAPGPTASVRKAIAGALGQHVMNLSRDLAGAVRHGAGDRDRFHLVTRIPGFAALTVGGGTAEVQRNIVLGLPRDPSSDP